MGTLNATTVNSTNIITSDISPTGGVASNQMGGVIQYVQAAHTAMTQRFTTTSSSYSASNYVVTITPKSTSSKILIQANLSCNAGSSSYIYVRVYNVTAGRYVNSEGGVTNDAMYESAIGGKSQWGMMPVEAVDIPNSTSAQTYKLYFRTGSGATAVTGWSSSAPNTMNFNYMSATEFSA